MSEHDKIKQLISAYFDDEVTNEEKDVVENHILECNSCKKFYKDLQNLSSSLNTWSNESLSPDLEQNINKKFREGKIMKKRNPLISIGISGSLVVSLLALVISAQLYTKRTLQARLSNVADSTSIQKTSQIALVGSAGKLQKAAYSTKVGEAKKYKPYYMEAMYKSDSTSPSVRQRTTAGYQSSRYLSDQATRTMSTPYEQTDATRGTPGYYSSKSVIMPYPPEPEVWVDGEMGRRSNTESYDLIYENQFKEVTDTPLSTFSIDVDTASYSNLRRFLNSGQRPPKDSVRIEEMVNYFVYDYPQPTGEDPFSINIEAAECPWNPSHDLVMIGLQGKELQAHNTPPSNLVFLIDVSGSMNQRNKLPLLKSAFRMMVSQLRPEERISIVTYAGSAGLVLDSAYGSDKGRILDAINRLSAGGSTAGGQGIKLAYDVAKRNFIHNGNNRVILATDGDFNVGVSSDAELTRIIEEKRKDGIFLTVLGFGTGNYKDSKMEKIADKGNGNYYYIDSDREARKVLVQELGSTLFTIAKDVKLQIEFNPAQIKSYRLIGYENRIMAKEDFNDDTKDAGELGAGHTVTAFYEVVPASSNEDLANVDPLKYQKKTSVRSKELLTVKLRYKKPDGLISKLLTRTLSGSEVKQKNVSDNFKWASAVVEFGLLLRDSKYRGNTSYYQVLESARQAAGQDRWGYRAEFISLVEKASRMGIEPTPIDYPVVEGGYRYK